MEEDKSDDDIIIKQEMLCFDDIKDEQSDSETIIGDVKPPRQIVKVEKPLDEDLPNEKPQDDLKITPDTEDDCPMETHAVFIKEEMMLDETMEREDDSYSPDSAEDQLNICDEAGSSETRGKKIYNIEKDADEIFSILHDGNLSDFADEEESILESRDELAEIENPQDAATLENESDDDSDWEFDFDTRLGQDVPQEFTGKTDIKWRQSALFNPVDLDSIESSQLSAVNRVRDPLEYFYEYLPPEIFERMVTYTNQYALQNNTSGFPPTNATEIKKLFGIHIYMSNLKLPRVRMYWEASAHFNLITEAMARNRFFKLRFNLHLVNNLEKRSNSDRMFKVRPIYDAILSRCRKLPLEREVCVGEQIVPFKGQLDVKQYIKRKPNPCGIKIFTLCGRSGLVYDLVIYQGSTTELDGQSVKQFGQGAAVVMHLLNRLPDFQPHFLYCDKYFTTYNLLEHCTHKGVLCAGRVRTNRFAGPPLMSDNEMRKKKRGFSQQLVSEKGDICLVKWQDSKTVVLASNFVGIGKTDKARTWDNKGKKYTEVDRPEIVRRYNESMGGVDKLDFLVGLYRIFIRSNKWTLRMVMHATDLALVNSWLEYRRDANLCKVPKKDILDLLQFRFRVAEGLIRVGNPVDGKKRGRPSLDEDVPPIPPPRRPNCERRPVSAVQYDLVDHMPEHLDCKAPGRCKLIGCTGKTRIRCEKCKVCLCLNKGRNCFKAFHRK